MRIIQGKPEQKLYLSKKIKSINGFTAKNSKKNLGS